MSTTTMLLNLVQQTLGALLLGTFVGLILYGLAIHQFYRYMRLHAKDSLSIRTLVSLTLTLETIHVAFSLHVCYYYMVSHYSQPSAFSHNVWCVNCLPILGSCIMVTTQFFFVRRVSLIGVKYRALAILATLCLSAKFVLMVYLTAKVFRKNAPTAFADEVVVTTGFGCAVVGDIVLTGALISVLRRGRATQKREHVLTETAVIYLVNTGMLICILDMVTVVVAAAIPLSVWWSGVNFVTVRLYANTLLSVLNSRKQLDNWEMTIFGSDTYGMNIIARANRIVEAERWNAPQLPEPGPAMLDIKVTTEVEGDSIRSAKIKV
ncbi:hypothetical protein BD311DRAFT_765129 [Dichomitus squalens]|uniref:DUF6534 domain-containing protein n=1 Tax=Dichomitus squalens TaxID=114155 RepID=A0A4Q9MH67_9APHY|nr:hypothetical protein BD311DRAFT_765129 [Dichomitus squalens]